jgi:hypothetical protein
MSNRIALCEEHISSCELVDVRSLLIPYDIFKASIFHDDNCQVVNTPGRRNHGLADGAGGAPDDRRNSRNIFCMTPSARTQAQPTEDGKKSKNHCHT